MELLLLKIEAEQPDEVEEVEEEVMLTSLRPEEVAVILQQCQQRQQRAEEEEEGEVHLQKRLEEAVEAELQEEAEEVKRRPGIHQCERQEEMAETAQPRTEQKPRLKDLPKTQKAIAPLRQCADLFCGRFRLEHSVRVRMKESFS